jgi:hypothetical protein
MVSEALKQFFLKWELCVLAGDRPCQKCAGEAFKSGFLAGYAECFGQAFGIDWTACPARLDVVEQVVLARNVSQHSELVFDHINHDSKTRSKYPRPFFLQADEVTFDANDPNSFLNPTLHINHASLSEAIEQVEQLCAWVQECIEMWLSERRSGPPVQGVHSAVTEWRERPLG